MRPSLYEIWLQTLKNLVFLHISEELVDKRKNITFMRD
nr:MAG TPA: hypothetical protein [Caudoviricetes sp.]